MTEEPAIKIHGLPDVWPTDEYERALLLGKIGDGFIRLIDEIIDAGKMSPFEAVRSIDQCYREEPQGEIKDLLAYVLLHIRAKAIAVPGHG